MPNSILNRRFLITGTLVLFSLVFIAFFKESPRIHPVFQGFIVNVVFFLVIPLLYSKMILKESLDNLGLRKGEVMWGIIALVACVLFGLLLIILLSKSFPIREQHMFPGLVKMDFFWFVLYETVLVSFVAFLHEVFFRGLIQFLWLGHLGFLAVFLQAGLLWGVYFMAGSLSFENAPLLLFAPLAGVIAHYSRSIWYSWAGSWLFLLLVDIFVLIQR